MRILWLVETKCKYHYKNNNYIKILFNNNNNNSNFIFFNNKFFNFYFFNFILKIIKFKLKGKTLKYKRISKNNLIFKFGLTHVINCWLLFTTYLKKKGKQKFFFFSYSIKILLLNSRLTIKWKNPNIYHWRGIRMTRMLMYRKAGKVSEYFK